MLGVVGQHLQGRQGISLRAFLLGLRGRHLSDLVNFRAHLGSTSNDPNSFLNNVHSADTSNIVSTMVGGAIFNLANLLLVAAIDMAGLAIAFPVSIGIA